MRRLGAFVTTALLLAGPGNAQQASAPRSRVRAVYIGSEALLPGSPAPQGDYALSIAGRRIELPAGVDRGTFAAGEALIVQFASPPSEADRARVRRRGFRFVDFISDTAYWLRATAPASLAGMPGLRAATRPDPTLKLGRALERAMTARPTGIDFAVQVGFFDDVPAVAQRAALRRVGVDAAVELLIGNRVRIRADRSRIAALAELPSVRVVELGEIGKRTHNMNSIGLIRADEARDRFKLSGRKVHVGIWDEKPPDAEHVEFGGRVTNVEGGGPSLHATHVTGSIAAAGNFAFAGGVAPRALTYNYDFDGDVAEEMLSAVESHEIVISNNSWGMLAGWEFDGTFYLGAPIMSWWGDEIFGAYLLESRALDELIRDHGLSIVFSAGNHRNDAVRADAYYDVVEDRVVHRHVEERDGPYTSIDAFASAKNVITVGATTGIARMTPFSSWGPTDDGRVKPEVCTPGLGVFSTLPGDDYGIFSGTSMSAALASGSLALLVDLWRRGHKGSDPSPAVLRNVLVATAVDPDDPGPDYRFGYGTMDVSAAAALLRGNHEVLVEGAISSREKQTFKLKIADGVERIRVTLAWLDPPGPELVNDLDVGVIPPRGEAILPWRLDPRRPDESAERGVNRIDNIEVVDVGALPAVRADRNGWTIEVSARRLGMGVSQDYVLTVLAR